MRSIESDPGQECKAPPKISAAWNNYNRTSYPEIKLALIFRDDPTEDGTPKRAGHRKAVYTPHEREARKARVQALSASGLKPEKIASESGHALTTVLNDLGLSGWGKLG